MSFQGLFLSGNLVGFGLSFTVSLIHEITTHFDQSRPTTAQIFKMH